MSRSSSMEVEIFVPEMRGTIKRLLKGSSVIAHKLPKTLTRIGLHWARESKLNAPEDRGIRGGLIAYIKSKAEPDGVKVFVPVNSPAGPYARVMDNHMGNWGRITRSKGARAGSHYITRARFANRRLYQGWIDEIFKEV